MRIYGSVTTTYHEIERDLFEMGIRIHPQSVQNKKVKDLPAYETIEIQDYTYMLTQWTDLKDFFEKLALSWSYVEAEFKDRISVDPQNPGSSYARRIGVWGEFLNEAGFFDYTYSERLYWQIPAVINVLRADPDSRQAVMQIYDYHRDSPFRGGVKRVPCSMFYQALIRRDQLDFSYSMRSCDFYTHFPYDMALAIRLLEYLATALNVRPGYLKHHIVSLHAFKKDFKEGIF